MAGIPLNGKAVLTVYTPQGRTIARVETSAALFRGGVNLDAGKFPAGVYLAKVAVGTREIVQKVVRMR